MRVKNVRLTGARTYGKKKTNGKRENLRGTVVKTGGILLPGGTVLTDWGTLISPSAWDCAEIDEETQPEAAEGSPESPTEDEGPEDSPRPDEAPVRSAKRGRSRPK